MNIINNLFRWVIFGVAVSVMAASCVSPNQVNYLQDMEDNSQIKLENKFEAVISPYDELSIYVSSYDQDLAKPFNLGGQYNASQQGSSGYLVDVNGNIQFPVLGELHVAGKTRLQLQDTIALCLQNDGYIADPYVMVRFKNFKIFFLGSGGGKSITIPNERCTFLEALALSGDLGMYTRRDRIGVMRAENGKMTIHYLDPRSSKIFNDPYFMLRQGDFIITDTYNKGTTRSEIGYWLGWVSTGFSLVTMITTVMLYNSYMK